MYFLIWSPWNGVSDDTLLTFFKDIFHIEKQSMMQWPIIHQVLHQGYDNWLPDFNQYLMFQLLGTKARRQIVLFVINVLWPPEDQKVQWTKPDTFYTYDSGHAKRVLTYWEKWGKSGKSCSLQENLRNFPRTDSAKYLCNAIISPCFIKMSAPMR